MTFLVDTALSSDMSVAVMGRGFIPDDPPRFDRNTLTSHASKKPRKPLGYFVAKKPGNYSCDLTKVESSQVLGRSNTEDIV